MLPNHRLPKLTTNTSWDNFIIHYSLPEKILSDQGEIFESEFYNQPLQENLY